MKNKKLFILLLIIPLIIFFIGRSFALPDDEEEEEIELDNWEISTVFYDSTVDNGHTPLTEINWDASNDDYTASEERTITVQINYKNSNTSKNYEPGEVVIAIPNLIEGAYSKYNILTYSTTVGANDDNHTGYDWNYYGLITNGIDSARKNTNNDPNVKNMYFYNTNPIEAKSNMEGSIQIVYKLKFNQVTPRKYLDIIEKELSKEFTADLFYMDSSTKKVFTTPVQAFSDDYFNYLNGFYIYNNSNSNFTGVFIRQNPYTTYSLTFYDNVNDELLLKIDNTTFKNTPLLFDSSHLKFSLLYSSVSGNKIEFYPTNKVQSNTLKFRVYKAYSYNWIKKEYNDGLTISQNTSIDNFPSNYNDYYWVEYHHNPFFEFQENVLKYPYVGVGKTNSYILDEFPNDVLVYDSSLNLLQKENGVYKSTTYPDACSNYGSSSTQCGRKILLAFPKSIYNSDNNNLNVILKTEGWGKYYNSDEYEKLFQSENEINLSDYNINNPIANYDISKSDFQSSTLYSQDINGGYAENLQWLIGTSVNYLGNPYSINISDDVLYIVDDQMNYSKMSDDDYRFEKIQIREFYRPDGVVINRNSKYDVELKVRYRNHDSYELYTTFKYGDVSEIVFNEEEYVVGFIFTIKDLTESISTKYGSNSLWVHMKILKNDVTDFGKIVNFNYLDVYEIDDNNNISHTNPVNSSSYDGLVPKIKSRINWDEVDTFNDIVDDIKNYDVQKYGNYRQRGISLISWRKFEVPHFNTSMSIKKSKSSEYVDDFSHEKITLNNYLLIQLSSQYSNGDKIVDRYADDLHDEDFVTGFVGYDLLPLGVKLTSSEDEMINTIRAYMYNRPYNKAYSKVDKRYLTDDELTQMIKERINITIKNNYNNTNRTKIDFFVDLSDRPLLFVSESFYTSTLNFSINFNIEINYNSLMEYGYNYRNYAFAEHLNVNSRKGYTYCSGNCTNGSVNDNGQFDEETNDINNDGVTNETIAYSFVDMNITTPVSTNQDVQTSVQSDLSNYNIGTINSSRNSNYIYKLRVRTGSNDITNLVIYNSIEDYAKNPQLEIVKASGGKQSWQGEFLGIDTSYAESKGYTVKTYYNENPKPGTLGEDDTWHEYTNETDKTKVKSLAFKYLNADGTAPAVLPANSLTYVLINMKSPNEDYITYAYNGCWTEWNAIDPITERPVDFITGINSNIVKVALPRSRDVEDIQLTLTKEWKDGSNVLNTRPNEVRFNLISNGDTSNANEVTITGTGNEWSVNVQAPELDNLGNEIEYSVTENPINTIDGYKYIETINDLTITNTLYKDITLKKLWKDNSDLYLTRPENVTYKVKQNGNDYQEVTFNGNLTSDEWTKVITVPVFDNNGNEYVYTVDEIEIDNYSKSCEGLTCTNTLSGNDTITVKKVWIDSENEYNTRPNSIDIKLKQNDSDYQTVHLTGNTNTWESEVITVPKYDSNGVKYEYTINETQLDSYGLVVYDQANYQVTNTLKKNISIVVTKKWVDGSNEQGIRPDELKINLLRNNEQYQELTLTGDSDTWTTTIEVPKYDDSQHEYTYSIKELTDSLNEDYSNITYGEDLSVTNKLEKKKNISISKTWDDYNNMYMTRPEKVTINILRNGELFQELELDNNNSWKKDVNDLDVYDSNGKLYKYTIEEKEQLARYESVTYDQTNYTITNKLTVIPKVTLYFTVKNGYLDASSGDLKFDQEGLNRVMSMHKLSIDTAYEYEFELENVDTGEIKKAKLSTEGTLKFEDIPYGTYRARESEDKYFKFVDMVEIENVSGVTFTEDDMGGTITISPTGKDIIYGTNTTNRIEPITPTPITSANRNYIIVYLLLIIGIFIGLYYYKKKVQ